MKAHHSTSIRLFYFTLVLWLASCDTEEIQPIDIFSEEESSANAAALPLNGFDKEGGLYANPDRINSTADGYQIKGTIFSGPDGYAITSGDFQIIENENGQTQSFAGYGNTQLPETGFLDGVVEMGDIYGSWVEYRPGRDYKAEAENLPIQDEQYYFRFDIDDPLPKGASRVMIKNTSIAFEELYMDTEDPLLLLQGDMKRYDKASRPQTSPQGKTKGFKSNAKSLWKIEDAQIGISVKGSLLFEPHEFSERLQEVIGDTQFEPFNGYVYMGGEVPTKKYPLLIDGRVVSYNQTNPLAIFEDGIESPGSKLGANGKVIFGHELLDMLPLETRVTLGQATLQYNVEVGNTYLRFAGEYDSDNLLKHFLGEEAFKSIPSVGREGKMFVNIGDDLSQWKLYMEQIMKINIPGMGQTNLNESVVYIDPSRIEMMGRVNLPFNIGSTEVRGELKRDGSFSLRGQQQVKLDFGNGNILDYDMEVEISNEGAFLAGKLHLPAGVSDFAVSGQITKEGIILKGQQKTNLDFGNGARLTSDLSLEASTSEGVFLSGMLSLPGGVSDFSVVGEVSARGLLLEGKQKTNIDFGGDVRLRSDIFLRAATFGQAGVYLSGMLSLPKQFGDISVIGEVSQNRLLLEGKINSMVNFGVTTTKAELSVKASTSTGVAMFGRVDAPFKLGWVQVEGELLTDQLFSLYGEAGPSLDFVAGEVKAVIGMGFSASNIKLSASGEFCTDVTGCQGIGLNVNPDWGKGKLDICAEFPVAGEQCIGL